MHQTGFGIATKQPVGFRQAGSHPLFISTKQNAADCGAMPVKNLVVECTTKSTPY
jgi:hypothetical protein